MKPILFNTEMVQAILEGRKTVTRRLVKPAPAGDGTKPEELTITRPGYWNSFGDDNVYRQPCKPGDILYVRETWCKDSTRYMYKANYSDAEKFFRGGKEVQIKWRPSIHMPKEAARLFLRVTDVRVERLQDMCLIDCLKEGVQLTIAEQGDLVIQGLRARDRFSGVWDSTIKTAELPIYGWEANPWVWVIEFERCEKPEEERYK